MIEYYKEYMINDDRISGKCSFMLFRCECTLNPIVEVSFEDANYIDIFINIMKDKIKYNLVPNYYNKTIKIKLK